MELHYYIHRDEAGRTLLRELRDAALRGVRVRLLVDDFFAAEIDDLLIGLASFPNVEVRLFNVRGKVKRMGRYAGKRRDWRKAYVRLKEGEKAPDFIEGV